MSINATQSATRARPPRGRTGDMPVAAPLLLTTIIYQMGSRPRCAHPTVLRPSVNSNALTNKVIADELPAIDAGQALADSNANFCRYSCLIFCVTAY